mmetsp:Transcript_45149/g.70648  ORF Transcript_45149/g.70648 Transcript_45149/m.70648 type:complete len:333 (-) Transcript_45149:530-1528(-)
MGKGDWFAMKKIQTLLNISFVLLYATLHSSRMFFEESSSKKKARIWVCSNLGLSLASFGLILIEICFCPIPSEASSFQIVQEEKSVRSMLGTLVTVVSIFGTFVIPAVVLLQLSSTQRVHPWLTPSHSKGLWWALQTRFRPQLNALSFIFILQSSALGTAAVQDFYSCHQSAANLCVSRAYAMTRNPINISMYLLASGLWLCIRKVHKRIQLSVIFFLFLYIWRMHGKILIEEARLALIFGSSYQNYKDSTPRYFSWDTLIQELCLVALVWCAVHFISPLRYIAANLSNDTEGSEEECILAVKTNQQNGSFYSEKAIQRERHDSISTRMLMV